MCTTSCDAGVWSARFSNLLARLWRAKSSFLTLAAVCSAVLFSGADGGMALRVPAASQQTAGALGHAVMIAVIAVSALICSAAAQKLAQCK